MNSRTKQYGENRLMDVPDLCTYLNLGRTKAVEYARAHGAEKRIGRRCLYDRKILDDAIDEMVNE